MNRTEVIRIRGMFCIHCEARIKKSLSGLDGIKSVSVSYRQSKAVVTFDPMVTSIDKMKKMIEDEGYEVLQLSILLQ
ncbi:MAG: heavy-metal-associated domain-containing protein [Anaerolineaceae bacterium]|nr:heavy-metal-associated domain-containing protein [Anaerolineaceae bacterium]